MGLGLPWKNAPFHARSRVFCEKKGGGEEGRGASIPAAPRKEGGVVFHLEEKKKRRSDFLLQKKDSSPTGKEGGEKNVLQGEKRLPTFPIKEDGKDSPNMSINTDA